MNENCFISENIIENSYLLKKKKIAACSKLWKLQKLEWKEWLFHWIWLWNAGIVLESMIFNLSLDVLVLKIKVWLFDKNHQICEQFGMLWRIPKHLMFKCAIHVYILHHYTHLKIPTLFYLSLITDWHFQLKNIYAGNIVV